MRKTIACFLLALGVAAAPASAQQAAAPKKSFDVASVKPAGPIDPQKLLAGQQRIGMKVDAGRVDIEGWSILELLNTAHKASPARLTGPAWPGLQAFMSNPLAIQRYDIHATFPPGATKDDVPEMLGSLLAERWKLQFHMEKKEQEVLALVVGKNGPKLEKSPEETPADPSVPANNTNRPDAISVSGDPTKGQMTIRGAGQAGTMKLGMSPDGSTIRMEAERLTMDQLADSLIQFTRKPVVNMTGLEGNYKVAFEISREDMLSMARAAGVNIPGVPAQGPAGGASDPGGTSAYQSVEKMGLTLENRRAPVEYFVVDRLEKTPTED